MKTIIGSLIMLAGVLVIIFRNSIIRERYAWQKENFGFKFGPRIFRYDQLIGICVGLILIVVGILIAGGAVNLR